jgi:hypothetical protein
MDAGRPAGGAVGYGAENELGKQRSRKGRACIVDPHGVISVDQAGEEPLRGLLKRGAQLAGTAL